MDRLRFWAWRASKSSDPAGLRPERRRRVAVHARGTGAFSGDGGYQLEPSAVDGEDTRRIARVVGARSDCRRNGWTLSRFGAADGQACRRTSPGVGFHSRRPGVCHRALFNSLPAFDLSIDAQSAVASDAQAERRRFDCAEGLASIRRSRSCRISATSPRPSTLFCAAE